MNEEISAVKINEINKVDVSNILQKVFYMMTGGLAITSVVSFIIMCNLSLLMFVLDSFYVWLIVELIIVIFLSARIEKIGSGTGILAYIIYAIINGITLTPVLLMYTGASVATVFLITAGMFGGAALFGKITKKDLTKAGSFFMMALIGLLIAGIVDVFIMNDLYSFIVSAIGIIIFVGLTAYDVQKIEKRAQNIDMENSENITKLVIMGALELYLDFINIFLDLLKILGSSRD